MDNFKVDVDVYEGPFDLLLETIKKHQIDVCDVPLASIIESFNEFIKENAASMEDLSGFLIVAALLMRIKANALLPKLESDEWIADDIDNIDPSIILVASLLEYKKFKNVALELQTKFDSEEKFYPSNVQIEPRSASSFNYLDDYSILDIAGYYLQMLARQIKEVGTSHLVGSYVTIEEKIDYVLKIIASAGKKQLTFSELAKGCKAKIELIVTFLALLELHKSGTVKLMQEQSFGEITVLPVGSLA